MLSRILRLTQNHNDLVGLDIDSDYIKLLKINKKQTPATVENFSIVPVPAGAIVKNEIKDPGAIVSLLSDALNQSNIKSKNMALAVSRSSTIIKNIYVDKRLTADELETRAMIEATHHFPDLVGESYLDFTVVDSTRDDSQLEVILVACRKDVVDPYLNVVTKAGLIPKVVDVNSFAFERSLMTMTPPNSELKTIALLNLNSNLSTLIVLSENKLIYAHDESFDTKRIEKQLKGLEEKSEDQTKVLKDSLSPHLRHTMHFFYSTRPHINIEQLLISGDFSKDWPLEAIIQDETGLKTARANPFLNMKINADINNEKLMSCAPTLVLCTGLALSHLE